MSKLEVDAIEPQSGTTLTIGASGDSVTLGSGATIKLDGNYPTGTDNVALGSGALDDGSLTGGNNTAIGTNALTANTTASNNTAVGYNSLCANTTGCQSVAVGYAANEFNTTGERQVSVGYQAMCENTTGCDNVATGWQALRKNTTGIRNTAVGSTVMRDNTTGGNLTAVGFQAVYSNTTGCCNTGVGYRAAFDHLTGNNNTSLGHTAEPSTTSVSNQFTLGNASVTNLRCNDTSISSLSDERDKENIEDVPFGLDYILALRPVKFDWNRRDGSSQGKKDFGFIAQELDKVEEQFGLKEYTRLVQKDNPEKWEADPMKTYPILIKAIQELKQENEDLKSRIEVLENS
jgi:trimeric autotransporter adhesin